MGVGDFDPRDPSPPRVPNFRGGPSVWIVFVIGPMLAALVMVGGFVWFIARMPDGPAFAQLREDMASVKQKLAAQDAVKAAEVEAKAAEARAIEEHNKLIDYKLDQLLTKHR